MGLQEDDFHSEATGLYQDHDSQEEVPQTEDRGENPRSSLLC